MVKQIGVIVLVMAFVLTTGALISGCAKQCGEHGGTTMEETAQ